MADKKPPVIIKKTPVQPVAIAPIVPPKTDEKKSWGKFVSRVTEKVPELTEDLIKEILEETNTKFSPDTFWHLHFLVVDRYIARNKTAKVDGYFSVCPVEGCGMPTILDPSKDRKWGIIIGWRCSVNPDHFMTWRWSHLKPYMTRNQGIGNDIQTS